MKRARSVLVLTLPVLLMSLVLGVQPSIAGKSCYQPDGMVREGQSPFLGNDLYNSTGNGQTQHRALKPGHLDRFRLKFQNDTSDCTDDFFIEGDGSSPGFKVRYLAAGMDVTSAVVNGTYTTASLGLGESENLDVTIRAKASDHQGDAKKVLVTAESESDISQSDTVGASVVVKFDAGDKNGSSQH